MKIPLRFQITEYDCGTVTLQNAFSYLFERESIPAEIIRAISLYTLDCYDKLGNPGQGGTSREAIDKMAMWITEYTNNHTFQVSVKHYLKEDVTEHIIRKAINANGCVVLRTYQSEDHYVLIINIDDKYVYMWDPYFLEENYYLDDSDVKIILYNLFTYNRRVSLKRFNEEQKNDFALGPISERECLTFIKNI